MGELFTTESKNKFPFNNDYLKMKGVLHKHPLKHSTDSLSNKEILELQDENGLTIWFARFFYKDICITGICRMAKFWIFWDGSGNYLGYRLNENDSLTKSDHIEFISDDYIKLHEILSDSTSILKDLFYENLAIKLENGNKYNKTSLDVDGYTSATPSALSKYVVKDAVFTCYTLWHTVYGETQTHIKDILSRRVNLRYVSALMNGNNTQKLFAVEIAKQDSSYFVKFEIQYLKMIASPDRNLSEKALSLISQEYLNNRKNQLKIIELMDDLLGKISCEIINKFQLLENVSSDAIILLLNKCLAGKVNDVELIQIYRIIDKQISSNESIKKNNSIKSKLIELSNSSNSFISNHTKNLLYKYQ